MLEQHGSTRSTRSSRLARHVERVESWCDEPSGIWARDYSKEFFWTAHYLRFPIPCLTPPIPSFSRPSLPLEVNPLNSARGSGSTSRADFGNRALTKVELSKFVHTVSKMLMILLRINHTLSFWIAHSASWSAQNWLDCTVRICADLGFIHSGIPVYFQLTGMISLFWFNRWRQQLHRGLRLATEANYTPLALSITGLAYISVTQSQLSLTV